MQENLTQKEIETVNFMKNGMGNHKIAQEMDAHLSTVKTFVSSLIRKLNAKNRTQAVYFAYTKGIIK